jgi:hypothetical protein
MKNQDTSVPAAIAAIAIVVPAAMVLPLGRILGVTGQSYLGLSKILDDLDL